MAGRRSFSGVHRAAVNGRGDVVAELSLYSGSNYEGLYGWTGQHGLFAIAVPGTQLAISPGVFRTVSSAFLTSDIAGADVPSSDGLTEDGLFAFHANFLGGESGVFTASFRDFRLAYFPCPADADGNDRVEPADVGVFVSRWFASVTSGTLDGDFDGNGAVTPADVGAFVTAWFAALNAGGC